MLSRTWGLPADSPYTVTSANDFMPTVETNRKKHRSKGRRLSAREAELAMRSHYGM
jgi:hypothetical protein